MAKFKKPDGTILDTAIYTRLTGQDAIDWANSQELFSGATLIPDESPEQEQTTAPAQPQQPTQPQSPTQQPSQSTNQLPPGVLVRDKSNGRVYFIDENKQFRYVSDPSWIQGAGVIDIDGSHIDQSNMGANLTEKPSFDFMGANEAQALMEETGISWQEPRGYNPSDTVGDAPGNIPTTPENLNSFIQEMIDSSPILSEYFENNPEAYEQFQNMPPELQGGLIPTIISLQNSIEAGNVINPDIEINPESVQEFLDDMGDWEDNPAFQEFLDFAGEELGGYFDELTGFAQDDLQKSLERLNTDFETGVRRFEDIFKVNMGRQAEGEAMSGTAFSSGREQRQERTIDFAQQKIDDYTQSILRTRQDLGMNAERRIGSKAFGGSGFDPLQGYDVEAGGFAQAGERSLFTPQGGLTGAIPKARETAISQRASELENIYRSGRNLDFNNLA